MRTAGLIVAAGRGHAARRARCRSSTSPSAAARVLARAVAALLAHPAVDAVQVVIHPDDRALYDAAVAGCADPRLRPPVAGRGDARRLGARRPRGAGAAAPGPGADPRRRPPLRDAGGDRRGARGARRRRPAAFPALPVVDALWRADGGRGDASRCRATASGGRRRRRASASPTILAAHRAHAGEAADDVAVARAAGLAVRIVPGDEANFKITTAADLDAGARASESAMDIRTGNGFDVHAFGPGDAVTLCGVAAAVRPRPRRPFRRRRRPARADRRDLRRARRGRHRPVVPALRPGLEGRRLGDLPRARAAARAAERGFAISHLDVHAGLRGAEDRPARRGDARRGRAASPASTPTGSASRRRPRSGSASPAAARASPRSPPRRWCGRDAALTRAIATFGYVGFAARSPPAPGARSPRCRPATCCTGSAASRCSRRDRRRLLPRLLGDAGRDLRDRTTSTPATSSSTRSSASGSR